MLVNTKAKVGVFSIALGAYLPQFPSLVPEEWLQQKSSQWKPEINSVQQTLTLYSFRC